MSNIFQLFDVVQHFPPLYYSDFGTNISVEAFFFLLLDFIKRHFLFYIFFLSPFPFSLITSLTHNAVTTLFLVNPSLPVHACFRRNQQLNITFLHFLHFAFLTLALKLFDQTTKNQQNFFPSKTQPDEDQRSSAM